MRGLPAQPREVAWPSGLPAPSIGTPFPPRASRRARDAPHRDRYVRSTPPRSLRSPGLSNDASPIPHAPPSIPPTAPAARYGNAISPQTYESGSSPPIWAISASIARDAQIVPAPTPRIGPRITNKNRSTHRMTSPGFRAIVPQPRVQSGGGSINQRARRKRCRLARPVDANLRPDPPVKSILWKRRRRRCRIRLRHRNVVLHHTRAWLARSVASTLRKCCTNSSNTTS